MTLYDGNGHALSVGARLGGGGEGVVHALGAQHVVKLFPQGMSAERIAKVRALNRFTQPPLQEIAAWPLGLVFDAQRRPAGFAMTRLQGVAPIAAAANPQARKRAFPQANWGWLAHVGHNLAVATESLHGAGIVVGDVNESNVLVASDARVRFIDVDSFAFSDGAHRFGCDVGTPMYQPPELQRGSFAGVERRPEHDRFGVAVLIFQLLFMGRHPWAGRWAGKGELSFERGEFISRLPFAYGKEAVRAAFTPPSDGVQMTWIPDDLQALFERAFGKSAPSARPSGSEWAQALSEFEGSLVRCSSAPTHGYPQAMGKCPWCRLERSDRPYFIGSAYAVAHETLDIAQIERIFREIPSLGDAALPADPALIPATAEPLDSKLTRRRTWWNLQAVGSGTAAIASAHWITVGGAEVLGAVLLLVLFLTRPPLQAVRALRGARLSQAEALFDELATNFRRVAGGMELERRRRELGEMLERYKALPAKHQAERQALERDRLRLQLEAHLDAALLADVRIWKIGKRTRTTLSAYGIESAKDVDQRLPLLEVPGIRDGKRAALARWVERVKKDFRFDPTRPLDPVAIAALERAQTQERSTLERHLRSGPQALARDVASARSRADSMRGQLCAVAESVAKARADYSVVA